MRQLWLRIGNRTICEPACIREIYMSLRFHFVVAKAHIDHVSLRGFYIDSESLSRYPFAHERTKKGNIYNDIIVIH